MGIVINVSLKSSEMQSNLTGQWAWHDESASWAAQWP